MADAGPGLAAAVALLLIDGGNLSPLGIALVTAVSMGFGMLSSVSRARQAKGWAVRTLLMNGGAVWIAAFSAASLTTTTPALVAMIGLGIGLAGTRALEVVELGALAVLSRVTGEKQAEKRQDAQNIIAAVHVALKDRDGRPQENDDEPKDDL